MANKRALKKELNNSYGEIIERSLIWQNENQSADHKEAEAIVDDSIKAFDELIASVNQRDVTDVKTHYKNIYEKHNTQQEALTQRVNSL